MLRITKLADYATLILHCFCVDPSQLLSAGEIARRTHLSQHTVSKILKILQAANLLTSTRGAVGGYSLIRPAEKITLAEIITALDGPVSLTECTHPTQRCMQNTTCNVKHHWKTINHFILTTLENITLADMSKSTPLSLTKKCLPTNATI